MKHNNIDIQAMLSSLLLPFMIFFAVFDLSPLTVYMNCFYIGYN